MTVLKTKSPYFAAVELGSNSFNLLIIRYDEKKLQVIDRESDMLQIARGKNADGSLAEYSMSAALASLMRFRERLSIVPGAHIRALATKTIRSASNAKTFLKKAEQALGFPIETTSGYEEARLIYTGLYHSVFQDERTRLVIDIGGASTEITLGSTSKPDLLHSLNVGCVNITKRFGLTNQHINEVNMRSAYFETCAQLEEISKHYLHRNWEIAFGTSGTIKSIVELTSRKGKNTSINKASLKELMLKTIDQKGIIDTKVAPLRRDVLPAGIAILSAIVDQLKLEEVHIANTSINEGLIYDSIGRASNHDIREIAIDTFAKQFKVDTDQANRVKNMALLLWRQIDGPPLSGISRTKILAWASYLSEVGLSVSLSAYQKHGCYLLQHSDLAGFSRHEQLILSLLVLNHRKRVNIDTLEILSMNEQKGILPLLICLRIATILARRRETIKVSPTFHQQGQKYMLTLNRSWLKIYPFTYAALKKEVLQLSRIQYELNVVGK